MTVTTAATTARQLGRRMRYAVVCVFAAAALLGNVAAAHAVGPTNTDAVTTVHAEYWDLRAYWGTDAPGLQWFNYRDSAGRWVDFQTPCGNTSAYHGAQGFYCWQSRVVYLDRGQQIGDVAIYGDGAAAFWLAHEYGHHIEYITKTWRNGKTLELLADCYAGTYFKYGSGKGTVWWADYQEARNQIWALLYDDGSHGSRQERLTAFDYGYRIGNWQTCAAAYPYV
jgi:hypothetical protein